MTASIFDPFALWVKTLEWQQAATRAMLHTNPATTATAAKKTTSAPAPKVPTAIVGRMPTLPAAIPGGAPVICAFPGSVVVVYGTQSPTTAFEWWSSFFGSK